MRAVWSFWSEPFRAHHRRVWASERHHWLAWALSFRTASRYYSPTALYTDSEGARILVDTLGLPFDEVHLTLDALADHDPQWWALGKLHTYQAQFEPFVHIDNDVFLWQPLPRGLENAPVLAQNPEYFTPGRSYYQPEAFEHALEHVPRPWLPPEWRWYRSKGQQQRAECCGIFGGNRTSFIRHYASQGIRLIEDHHNQPAWQKLRDKIGHNILFEQYLLAACIDYHRDHEASPYRNIAIRYLFASIDEAFDEHTAARLGYTHLIADAKRNPALATRLEARVARDHPADYERCVDHLARRRGQLPQKTRAWIGA